MSEELDTALEQLESYALLGSFLNKARYKIDDEKDKLTGLVKDMVASGKKSEKYDVSVVEQKARVSHKDAFEQFKQENPGYAVQLNEMLEATRNKTTEKLNVEGVALNAEDAREKYASVLGQIKTDLDNATGKKASPELADLVSLLLGN